MPSPSQSILCVSIHKALVSENFSMSEQPVHTTLHHTVQNLVICGINHSVVLLCNYLLSPETHGNHLLCGNCTISIFCRLLRVTHRTGRATEHVHANTGCLVACRLEQKKYEKQGGRQRWMSCQERLLVQWISASHCSQHHASVSHTTPCTK